MTTSTTEHPDLSRFDASQGPRKVGPGEGDFVELRGGGVRFMVWGEESRRRLLAGRAPDPAALAVRAAAPPHGEDEYSFVLEGRMGALLGDEVVYAEAGDLVFKPRDQWHTFWNAGDEPCRILEIIAPGGFEHFFREIGDGLLDGDARHGASSAARYGDRVRPGEHPAPVRRARAHAPDARRLSPLERRSISARRDQIWLSGAEKGRSGGPFRA